MRTLLTILAVLSVISLSAQATTETREYYLNKSKNQKTAGYILAGGGGALIIAGIIVGDGDNNNNDPNELDFGPNFDFGMWLVGGGVVSALASIPLFIGSSNNAKKAATISISHQKIIIPNWNSHGTVLQPAISLKVPL